VSKKMTRRDLAAVLGSVAGIASARPQAPAASVPEDLNAAAKEQLRKNSEALSKFDLPMSTEPAFLFKA
jgi:hypothetical protein